MKPTTDPAEQRKALGMLTLQRSRQEWEGARSPHRGHTLVPYLGGRGGFREVITTLQPWGPLEWASLVASLVSKESACNAGDPGSVPGSGRSPGEGIGYPLWYSCLENPMDCSLPGSSVHGVARVRHDLATTPPSPLECNLCACIASPQQQQPAPTRQPARLPSATGLPRGSRGRRLKGPARLGRAERQARAQPA